MCSSTCIRALTWTVFYSSKSKYVENRCSYLWATAASQSITITMLNVLNLFVTHLWQCLTDRVYTWQTQVILPLPAVTGTKEFKMFHLKLQNKTPDGFKSPLQQQLSVLVLACICVTSHWAAWRHHGEDRLIYRKTLHVVFSAGGSCVYCGWFHSLNDQTGKIEWVHSSPGADHIHCVVLPDKT